MKRGPLSKEEKFFLEQNKHKTVKFLAKKLDRYESIVSSFLESITSLEAEGVEEVKPVEKPAFKRENKTPSLASQTLARNKRTGSVIMTPASSMASDEVRKARSSRPKESRHIFIMNPDKE